MQVKTSVAWQLNCGYARTTIRELSKFDKHNSRVCIDRKLRPDQFRSLFSSVEGFDRPSEFSEESSHSTFNEHCKYVLNKFSLKWASSELIEEYCSVFF